MLRKIKNAFLTGMLILLPLGLTAYILYAGFVFFDNILQALIQQILYRGFGLEFFRTHTVPGIGLITLLAITLFTGILARNLIIGRMIKFGNRLLVRIPLFNKIYKTLVQISESVFSEKDTLFKKPVLIEYPRPGMYSLAFVTKETPKLIQDATEKEVVSVFLPTSPNPTSGFLLFVDKTEIHDIDISTEDAIKVVISAATVMPEENPQAKN